MKKNFVKKNREECKLDHCIVHRYRSDRVAQYMAKFPGRKYLGWVDSKFFGETNVTRGGKTPCSFTANDGGAYIVTEEISKNE